MSNEEIIKGIRSSIPLKKKTAVALLFSKVDAEVIRILNERYSGKNLKTYIAEVASKARDELFKRIKKEESVRNLDSLITTEVRSFWISKIIEEMSDEEIIKGIRSTIPVEKTIAEKVLFSRVEEQTGKTVGNNYPGKSLKDDISEVAVKAMVQVSDRIIKEEYISNLGGLINTIVSRRWKDLKKAFGIKKQKIKEYEEKVKKDNVVSEEASEITDNIKEILESCPKCKKIIELQYKEDLPIRLIATQLGLSEKETRKLVKKCRKKIKDRLYKDDNE